MNKKWIGTALSVVATLTVATGAFAQKKSGAEVSLIGIKLYDTGLRVVSLYGTPDSVEAVNAGGTSIGPGGGGPGGPGGRGGPGGLGGPVGGPGGGGGPSTASADITSPFDFGNDLLPSDPTSIRQGATPPSGPPVSAGGGRGAAPAGVGGGGGRGGGPSIGGPGGAPMGPGGGGAGATNGRILYTRWIYNRNGSKYGFVLDKSNRVVQIEAIGLSNPKVKTKRGVGFGATFAQLIKKYSAPDGYEINGDNVVVRFLVKNKVAFRLSRLGPNKPQVVTGIVVAAGKT